MSRRTVDFRHPGNDRREHRLRSPVSRMQDTSAGGSRFQFARHGPHHFPRSHRFRQQRFSQLGLQTQRHEIIVGLESSIHSTCGRHLRHIHQVSLSIHPSPLAWIFALMMLCIFLVWEIFYSNLIIIIDVHD